MEEGSADASFAPQPNRPPPPPSPLLLLLLVQLQRRAAEAQAGVTAEGERGASRVCVCVLLPPAGLARGKGREGKGSQVRGVCSAGPQRGLGVRQPVRRLAAGPLAASAERGVRTPERRAGRQAFPSGDRRFGKNCSQSLQPVAQGGFSFTPPPARPTELAGRRKCSRARLLGQGWDPGS